MANHNLGDKRLRFTDAQRRRLARRGKAVGGRGLRELGCIVSPDTILRWYRQLVAQKYDGSSRRGPGRPRTPGELAALVVSLAHENPSWGYTRIRDVLRSLGHDIGRTTIQGILRGEGVEPAPTRNRGVSWNEFLRSHWGAIAACDFLTVEVLTLRGLVRYHVLIVIDLATRRVEMSLRRPSVVLDAKSVVLPAELENDSRGGGITCDPTGAWLMQAARNLLDVEDGLLLGKTHLIMDRDPVFTKDVREFLSGAGGKIGMLGAFV